MEQQSLRNNFNKGKEEWGKTNSMAADDNGNGYKNYTSACRYKCNKYTIIIMNYHINTIIYKKFKKKIKMINSVGNLDLSLTLITPGLHTHTRTHLQNN